ncbi:hypothetical protein TWF481_009691 [Arthrobotrys musiformis]|uniref:Uncharacterized protein n=1 Tax=Arthrobotrys musiformis TaxID=47236 RepID=A0AAV9W6H8_9PEZI
MSLNPMPAPFQFTSIAPCTNDCAPIILSSRYCSSLYLSSSAASTDEETGAEAGTGSFDNITAYTRCFCNNPYILPLTTGLQCSFLCGHSNRANIIDFLKSPLACGAYPPWNTISSRIPGPETFAPDYSPAERWWRRWSDGERFGIILGCFLGFWFVGFFVLGAVQRVVSSIKARNSK